MTEPRELVVLGVSHRTAPLDVRERLAVAPDELTARLQDLARLPGVREGALLSTCNRVEIYAAASDRVTAFSALRDHLAARLGPAGARAEGVLDPHLYRRHGRAAIHHLFRVAASLDSLVVGEPQILGQIKDAFQQARAAGTVGAVLGDCFPRAFRVARRIRRETGIGAQAVSVSSIAVELARGVFDGFAGRRVLLVGAGKMSALAARALRDAGAAIAVTNRTVERAQALAAAHGFDVVPFPELERALGGADIVITSTGARQPILDRAALERVQRARRHRPLVVVDIAVPRDVEPAAGQVEGVFLWDIDDLQGEAARHLDGRRQQAEAAETVIEEEVVRFLGALRGQEVGPTIRTLRARFAEIGGRHLQRLKERLPGDARVHAELERGIEQLLNELLHAPQVALRRAAQVRPAERAGVAGPGEMSAAPGAGAPEDGVDEGNEADPADAELEAGLLAAAVQRLFDLPGGGEPGSEDT